MTQRTKHSSEDIFVWADGSWCYRHELPETTHMSDDYKLLLADTPEWEVHEGGCEP